MNTTDGKHLTELIYEVDVLYKYIVPLPDNGRACLCWQPNGTLALFAPDGYPWLYYSEHHEYPHNNREDFTSLARFIDYIKREVRDSEELRRLLTAPVWCVYEDGREAFNTLLGDIEIEL